MKIDTLSTAAEMLHWHATHARLPLNNTHRACTAAPYAQMFHDFFVFVDVMDRCILSQVMHDENKWGSDVDEVFCFVFISN